MLQGLMLLLLPPLVCSEAREGVSLGVMSFNMRYGTAPDGDNAWPKRRGVLLDMLRSHSPDIIGAQECLLFQARYLAEQMPQYQWIGLGRESDGKGEMAALFYKPRVASPIRTGHFWLSETPDVAGSQSWGTHCTRMATWAQFRHIATDRHFYVFNTHFDHGSAQAREESARLLLRRIGELADGAPVVVTGDFNDSAETSPAWTILTEDPLRDSWLVAQDTAGPEVTFHNWQRPLDHPQGRIDWILIGGHIEAERVETVAYNENGHYPSDHYPVFTRLSLGRGE